MILEKLVLHHFGIFRGRHEIELSPVDKKPIILFGALNGRGKTTILDALQLVLYGHNAECSNRKDLPYEEFLRRCINTSIPSHEGASIQLYFSKYTGGKKQRYFLFRHWTPTDKGVKEKLSVRTAFNDKDSYELDSELTDEWQSYVETLIPSRLARFFFFDGEKIEALADLDNSKEVLTIAVKSLLGLDQVEHLQADLRLVEKRTREKNKNSDAAQRSKEAGDELGKASTKVEEVLTKVGQQNNTILQLKKQLQAVENEFQLAGGEAYEQRANLLAQKEKLDGQRNELSSALQGFAGGEAPLLLIEPLLRELQVQPTPAQLPVQALLARDSETLRFLTEQQAPKKLLETLREFFIEDRGKRHEEQEPQQLPDFARFSPNGLSGLLAQRLPNLRAELKGKLGEYDKLNEQLTKVERRLESVPAEESIAPLQAQLEALRKELLKAEAMLQLLNEELDLVRAEKNRRNDVLYRLITKGTDELSRQRDSETLIQRAELVRAVLGKFHTKVVERHIKRLEQFILESFSTLLGKKSLTASLTIDVQTYQMTLYDESQMPLSPERLSAGERQLLALSIIWGMARAAGRPLPVVVDTPLGRLDSVHRQHLVERYFPQASHQVILLSTDKEIDETELERLKDDVGRSYKLIFDEKTKSSRVEPGYFW